MSALLDALTTIGAVFDTPGAILRNTLAGEDPFRGLFAPEERTYGRDLLETWGVLDENQEGLDWGDVAGFGVDVVADPLSIFGLGKAAGGLGRMAGRYADEAAKAPTLGVFGGSLGDFSKYGKQARQLDPDEAMQLYKGWADSLTPEEADAMRLFTSGPQDAISSTLRGKAPRTPLNQLIAGHKTNAPAINSIERVLGEVVPYADSALGKSAGVLPEDIVTYRLSGQLGDLTAANARSKIGEMVTDPSYMSTTITPYGRFYGNATGQPGDMLLDILYPKGTPGAFPNAGKLSSYPNELELMTPRDLPLRVLDVQDVPAAKVGYNHFKLTPEGKPIPLPGSDAGKRVLFDEQALYDLGQFNNPLYPAGTFDTPPGLDDLLVPGWEDVIVKSPKTNFTNVLLEATPEGILLPRDAATRRLTDIEVSQLLEDLAPKVRDTMSDPKKIAHFSQRTGLDGGKLQKLANESNLPMETLRKIESEIQALGENAYLKPRYDELQAELSQLIDPLEAEKIMRALEGGTKPHPAIMRDAIGKAVGVSPDKIGDMLRLSVPKERAIPSMLEILKKAGIPVAGVTGATSPLLEALMSEQAA